MQDIFATATVTINAPISQVWRTLTDPQQPRKFMFGPEMITDWKEGSEVVYRGERDGQPFEDKGRIVKVIPEKMLVMTHYNPNEGEPAILEECQAITYDLSEKNGKTIFKLGQDTCANAVAKVDFEKRWPRLVSAAKKMVDGWKAFAL
jgi:uncharacterized protein YndB with AHSA1/START domain